MEHFSPQIDLNSDSKIETRPTPKSNRFFEREYIDSLKEDVVKDILTTILSKAGNEKALDNFIPFKDILTFQNANEKISGSYYAENHTIELNKHNLLQDEKETTKSITLATILHEELHAITNKNFEIKSGDTEGRRQVGFQTETIDAITRQSLGKTWVSFNEGITELIKDDILEEYIKRTGDRKDFLLQGYEAGLPESTYQTYLAERALVNVIINRVSADSGVSRDFVREAFVHAYFSGSFLDVVKKDLSLISGEDLIARIDTGVIVAPKSAEEKLSRDQENEKSGNDQKNMEILVRLCTNFMKRGLAN